MANELRASINVAYTKGIAKVLKSLSFSADITGEAYIDHIQTIGTVNEELTQPIDLGTPGYILIVNLSDTVTDSILITTADDANYVPKVFGGKFAFFYPAGATLYAKGNVELQALILWFEA